MRSAILFFILTNFLVEISNIISFYIFKKLIKLSTYMTFFSARAPGKILLSGGYAILYPKSKGIVLAVDSYF